MYSRTNEGGGGLRIAEIPPHNRPRERLMKHGARKLHDAELLAIILRTGTRGRSALDLAWSVVAAFDGDLKRVATAGIKELCQIPGVGKAKAIEIQAALELARRLGEGEAPARTIIHSSSDVANLLRGHFAGRKQEEFHVLMLDAKNGVLKDSCVTVGLLDRSQVHAREVFCMAIRENCSRIILAHNHPSGDPNPSPQDIACTKILVQAGELVGIPVMDHIIVGRRTLNRPSDYLSFKDSNLM
jgi:DNA repair protein RadC